MTDNTELLRRQRLAEFNALPGSRPALEARHGKVGEMLAAMSADHWEWFRGGESRFPRDYCDAVSWKKDK